LGSVLYKTHDYKWALRCFLKARDLREITLGEDSIDTATVYNNIACCLHQLERINESFSFIELSHAILEEGLGPFHYRTTTALRNLAKVKKSSFKTKPEFKMLWVAWVEEKFGKKKKKKKKKGK